MKVACCSIRFYLHGNQSLKGKRRVAKSIKDRIKNKFNISIAEIGDQDRWQNLHLGIACVGSDARVLEAMMEHVVAAIDRMNLAEITDSQIRVTTMAATDT
jgi:uncharacterized protein YlxP (DUF503 family)